MRKKILSIVLAACFILSGILAFAQQTNYLETEDCWMYVYAKEGGNGSCTVNIIV